MLSPIKGAPQTWAIVRSKASEDLERFPTDMVSSHSGSGPCLLLKPAPGATALHFVTDPARAEDIAQALLLKTPDLDGIYVTWAEPAEGVLAALRAAGNTKTRIVTLDLSEPIARA